MTPFETFCDLCEEYIGQLSEEETDYAREVVAGKGWYLVETTRGNDMEISYVGELDERELARLRTIEAADGFEALDSIISAPNADCMYIRVD